MFPKFLKFLKKMTNIGISSEDVETEEAHGNNSNLRNYIMGVRKMSKRDAVNMRGRLLPKHLKIQVNA